MYPYLNLGHNILFPLYNLFIGIGIVFGLIYLDRQCNSLKIKFLTDRNLHISLIISIILGFLGAKIFDLIYLGNNINLHNLYIGGTTFMGGVITAGIVFVLINSLLKTNNLFAFNLVVPSLMIAHIFGRIGCFLGGCCYGNPTNLFFGVKYPETAPASVHFGSSIYSHPTQLYESFFLIVCFIVIEKYSLFKNKIFVYLIGYGTFRFFIEFIRADERGQILTELISPSQITSILFVLFGIISILIRFYFSKKSASTNNF